ncbi:ABC transporter ATP-binding protein [Cloacibacillus sp.]
MSSEKPILEIDNLVVDYETEDGVVHAVTGMNLSLGKKKTLGLVGETGAGKTTTALAILRLIPDPPGVIKNGSIKLNGVNTLDLSIGEMRKLRGNFVSMIFQDPMTSLNPALTVGDQIAEVIETHQNVSKGEALKQSRKMLETVGISSDRIFDYPHQFSGGMRQRVVIAMALACRPKLMIADEPTTALDVTIQAQILGVMKELKQKYDMSMIMITHDLGIVAEICDEVSVIYAGKVVEYGTLDDVFNNMKHPYTEGLFNSLPNINRRGEMLKPIQGLMPDSTDDIVGCAFASRCVYASERCFVLPPTRHTFAETHYILCSAYDEPDFKIKRELCND